MIPRIRTVKPDLFQHEALFEAEADTGLPLRLAFIGLFTCCDREGRFEWKPRRLKLHVLPWDDVDFSRVLDALLTRGFIGCYACGDRIFGFIPSWSRHQAINNREAKSEIPDPASGQGLSDPSGTREARVDDASATRHGNVQGEGKGIGREGKGREGKARSADAPTRPDGEPPEHGELTLEPPEGDLTRDPVAVWIPVVGDDKGEPILQSELAEWQLAFPGVDVPQALQAIRLWNRDNKARRKTRGGVRVHVTKWLTREQNASGTRGARVGHSSLTDHNIAVAKEWLNG